MRTTRSILVILGVAVLMATSAATVAAGGRPIVVEMTGAQEAPGPGDPDGTGTASFWINPGQEELCSSSRSRTSLLPMRRISTSRRSACPAPSSSR